MFQQLIPRDISIQILARRIQLKLSQDELAKLTNIDVKIIDRIENYNYIYKKDLIYKITSALDMTLI